MSIDNESLTSLFFDVKVRSKEDHKYLGVTKRQVGVIVSVYEDQVSVRYKNKPNTLLFQASELRRVK
jgi:hypothetical protein